MSVECGSDCDYVKEERDLRAASSTDDATQPLHAGQDGVALLDDSGVPRILGVRSVRLDDAVDAVDRARQPACRNEPREVSASAARGIHISQPSIRSERSGEKKKRRRPGRRKRSGTRGRGRENSRIQPLARNSKRRGQIVQRNAPVTLEQLGVRLDPQLARVVLGVNRQQA